MSDEEEELLLAPGMGVLRPLAPGEMMHESGGRYSIRPPGSRMLSPLQMPERRPASDALSRLAGARTEPAGRELTGRAAELRDQIAGRAGSLIDQADIRGGTPAQRENFVPLPEFHITPSDSPAPSALAALARPPMGSTSKRSPGKALAGSPARSGSSPEDQLAAAIREQRVGDGIARGLSGLARAATGGLAQARIPGSTALEDYMTRRNAAKEDRREKLQEQRSAAADARAGESHQARMRKLEQEFQEAERSEARRAQLRDPSSELSQRARDAYIMMGRTTGVEDIEALVAGRSAQELRESPEFQMLIGHSANTDLIDRRGDYTKYGYLQKRRARGIRGLGGAGGRGRGRASTADATDAMGQAFIRRRMNNGLTQEEAAQEWAAIKDTQTARNRVANNIAEQGTSTVATRNREGRLTALAKIRAQDARMETALAGYEDAVERAGDLSWTDTTLGSLSAGGGITGGAANLLAREAVQDLARYAQELSVLELYDETGAAITEAEFERKKERLKLGLANGPEALQRAVDDLVSYYRERQSRLAGAWTDSELKEYNDRVERARSGSRGFRDTALPSRGQSAVTVREEGGETRTVTMVKDGQEREFTVTQDQLIERMNQGWRLP